VHRLGEGKGELEARVMVVVEEVEAQEYILVSEKVYLLPCLLLIKTVLARDPGIMTPMFY